MQTYPAAPRLGAADSERAGAKFELQLPYGCTGVRGPYTTSQANSHRFTTKGHKVAHSYA